jgi:hypothetical protein
MYGIGYNYVPNVVPAECITYFSPDLSISRCTSAICADTEAEPVPIYFYKEISFVCVVVVRWENAPGSGRSRLCSGLVWGLSRWMELTFCGGVCLKCDDIFLVLLRHILSMLYSCLLGA